jgi:hypothetical protein
MRPSVQTTLLDYDVLTHNQTVSRHFPQLRQYSTHVFIRIDEGENHRQLAAGLDKMGRAYFAPALEAGDGVKDHCPGDVLLTQILQHLQMQRAVMPRIAFREVHGHLYGHRSCHSTTTSQ